MFTVPRAKSVEPREEGPSGIRRPLEKDLGGQYFGTRTVKMGMRTEALVVR